jgi:hypothetical protein
MPFHINISATIVKAPLGTDLFSEVFIAIWEWLILTKIDDSNELSKRPDEYKSRPSAAGMPQRSLHGCIHGESAL